MKKTSDPSAPLRKKVSAVKKFLRLLRDIWIGLIPVTAFAWLLYAVLHWAAYGGWMLPVVALRVVVPVVVVFQQLAAGLTAVTVLLLVAGIPYEGDQRVRHHYLVRSYRAVRKLGVFLGVVPDAARLCRTAPLYRHKVAVARLRSIRTVGGHSRSTEPRGNWGKV